MSDKPAEKADNGAIPVVTADGKVGYLPAALANDASATEGLRKASDTEIRGAQVKANQEATDAAIAAKFEGSLAAELEGYAGPALAGAARGVTLGGSDVALSQLGGDSVRRRLADYQAYAPITSTVGEIGGIVGASLLGEEASLGALPNAIGRIGARAGVGVEAGLGGGLLARGAGVLARGGTEGAFYGAGSAVTEATLKDHELTAQALIGGAAHGAIGGAAIGGALHGAGAGLGAVGRMFRGKGANAEAFEAIAAREFGEAAPKVGDALAADAEKIQPRPRDVLTEPKPGVELPSGDRPTGPYREAGDAVGEKYIDTFGGEKKHELGEIWKNRQVAMNDGAETIENHSRDFQKAITEQQAAAKTTDMATFGEAKVNHMEKLVDKTRFNEQANEVMQWMFKAQEQINLLASDTAVTKLGPAARKEFDGQMVRLGKALESGDSLELFKAADNAKRFLGREAQFGRRAQGLPEAAKAFDALYQGEGGLMGVLEHGSWGQAGTAQKAVNAATAEHISLGNKFSRSFVEEYGSTAGRPDYRANSEKVTSFLGRLTKAANDGDAQAVRDMIASRRKYLDATATNYDHGGGARTAIGQERSALDRMEATFEKATKETALINQVKRLQSEEQAQKVGGLLGLATDTATKPMTTLFRLAQLEEQTGNVIKRIKGGAEKLAGNAAEVPGTAVAPKGKGFFSQLLDSADSTGVAFRRGAVAESGRRAQMADETRRVTTLVSNPAAVSARIGGALGTIATQAPKTTAAATSIAMSGLSFLASKLPPGKQDPYSLQPQLQPITRASDAEIASYFRYKEAIDDPTALPSLALSGKLTAEHVEAVKAVYPKLYETMQTQVMTQLVNSTSPLPYGRRIQLGVLLDLPTDATLAPDFVSAIQATYTASEQAGVEPPNPNMAALDVSSALETPTQHATAGLGLGR